MGKRHPDPQVNESGSHQVVELLGEELYAELKEMQAKAAPKRAYWSEAEDAVLREFFGTVSNPMMLEILQKAFPDRKFSYNSTVKRASNMGLAGNKPRRPANED